MDGSPAIRLGEGRAQGLSPDGKWALALQTREPPHLVLLPTGAGDSLVLPRGNIEKYVYARWMPDGRNILFAGSEAGHGTRSYVQEIGGGVPRPVTPVGISAALVSRDGRRIIYRARNRLYLKSLEADSGEVVADRIPGEGLLQWASDGRWIYVAQLDSTIRVSKLDVTTGKRVSWKTISFADRAGLVLVNSTVVVTPSGEAYAVDYARVQKDLYLVEGLK
jgi:dipeptidyl aminopeptidase/acylaminoacyl peptidase